MVPGLPRDARGVPGGPFASPAVRFPQPLPARYPAGVGVSAAAGSGNALGLRWGWSRAGSGRVGWGIHRHRSGMLGAHPRAVRCRCVGAEMGRAGMEHPASPAPRAREAVPSLQPSLGCGPGAHLVPRAQTGFGQAQPPPARGSPSSAVVEPAARGLWGCDSRVPPGGCRPQGCGSQCVSRLCGPTRPHSGGL